jgi:hypothetical protein
MIRLAIITVIFQLVIRIVIHIGMELTVPNIVKNRIFRLDTISVMKTLG